MSKFLKLNSMILLIIISLFISSFTFADDITQEQIDIANSLVTMGYVQGYPDGELGLENNITRAEFTVLAIRLLDKEYLIDEYKKETSFVDVPKKHWASGYINIAIEENIIKGYGNKKFGPEDNISHAEILTMLVRILGFDEKNEKGINWYTYYIDKAKELGINYDESLLIHEDAKRGEVFIYFYNSLPILLDQNFEKNNETEE